MVIVLVHLFHRKVLLLTDLAIRSIFVLDEFEFSADLAIELLTLRYILQSVADHMETCVTDIAVDNYIALVV